MGYFGTYFDNHLEHRATYGTANSVSSEKGTDNKKNNTSEYNHKYYEKHKDKWAKEGKYDPNGDDEDFKKVYGNDLKNPKLNMDTHIKGTDFYTVKNKDGQVVLINGGRKWTLPKGVELTDAMKQQLAGIDSNQGKQGNEFLGKMAKFLDEAAKANPAKSSSTKKSSEEKTDTTKKSSGETKSFDEAKTEYYEKKKKEAQEAANAANDAGKKRTEYEKKKKFNTKNSVLKHYDDLGSVLLKDIF